MKVSRDEQLFEQCLRPSLLRYLHPQGLIQCCRPWSPGPPLPAPLLFAGLQLPSCKHCVKRGTTPMLAGMSAFAAGHLATPSRTASGRASAAMHMAGSRNCELKPCLLVVLRLLGAGQPAPTIN